jgi:hypothetical protein
MHHIVQAFIEGYTNGFVACQTPLQTAADFLGNAIYTIIHLF